MISGIKLWSIITDIKNLVNPKDGFVSRSDSAQGAIHYLCQMVGTIIALAPCSGKNSMLHLHSGGSKIEKTIAYMEKHLYDMVSLDELAQTTDCSRSHLNYLFQKISGHSPLAYFLRKKCSPPLLSGNFIMIR